MFGSCRCALPILVACLAGICTAQGDAPHVIYCGPGTGSRAALFSTDAPFSTNAFPFGQNFSGGINVAAGDFNGDGRPDLVAGVAGGGGPQVVVLDGKRTGVPIASFFAFDQSFQGGVRVAAGDVNGDGTADIIAGAGPGGGPQVSIFDGTNNSLITSFFAFAPTFQGGVRVAAGDVNGDGLDDVIVGVGSGGGPTVSIFNGLNQEPLASFLAFDATFTGGVFVASGDVNGDSRDDIIVGSGSGGGPVVRVFSGVDQSLIGSFFPYALDFTGGVRVASADINGDGLADIVTGPGPGGAPNVRAFTGGGVQLANFLAFSPNDTSGIFVASGNIVTPPPSVPELWMIR